MKILKLTFKNLNSLKGEHCIDFSTPPFSDTGLFAITGETGAGKTTLLDAIILALYNSIPRGSDKSEVISYSTGDAFSEVEFMVKGKKYRVNWSIKKARNSADGKVQPFNWKLSDITDVQNQKIIAEKKKEVADKMVEITGLDKDKFLQSVMLSQGNFAAFLKADANQRGELLEKITGQSDYSHFSKAAFEKAKLEDDKLQVLNAQIDTSLLLADDQIEILNTEQKELLDKIAQLGKEQTTQIEQKTWLENLNERSIKIKNAEEELSQLKEDKIAAKTLENELALHARTLPFSEALGKLDGLTSQIKETKDQVNTLSEKHRQSEKLLAESQKDVYETELVFKKHKNEFDRLKPQFIEARKLDNLLEIKSTEKQKTEEELSEALNKEALKQIELKALKDQAVTLNRQKSELENWLNEKEHYAKLPENIGKLTTYQDAWAELLDQITQKENQQTETKKSAKISIAKLAETKLTLSKIQKEEEATKADLRTELEKKHALIGDQNIEAWDTELEEIHANGINLKELKHISTQYISGKEEFEQKQKQSEALITFKNDLSIEKEKVELELSALTDHIKTAQEKQQLALRIKNYEEDRKQLIDGKPCFVCGSTDHPYIDHSVLVDPNSDGKKIKELEQEKAKLQENLNRINKKIPSEKQWELHIDETQKLEEKLNTFNTAFDDSLIDTPFAFKIDELHKIDSTIDKARDEYLKLNDKKKAANEIAQKIAQHEKDLNSIAKKIGDNKAEHASFSATLEADQKSISGLTKEIDTLLDRRENLLNQINTILAPCNLSINETNTFSMLLSELEKQVEEFTTQNNTKNDVDKKLQTNTIQAENASKDLDHIITTEIPKKKKAQKETTQNLEELTKQRKLLLDGKEADTLENDWNTILKRSEAKNEEVKKAFTDAKTAMDKLQSNLESNTVFLSNYEKEYANLEATVIEKATPTFISIAELKMARMETNVYDQNTATWELICKNLENGLTRFETLKSEQKTDIEKNLTDLDNSTLEKKIEDLKNSLDLFREKKEQISIQLNNDKKTRERFASITKNIEQQKKEHLRWETLNQLIGSASGDKFRRFAQHITLGVLVEQANTHLELLNPRYYIALGKNDASVPKLQLDIVDTYQADYRRPMNTLSGGESFLVSLALALGLSDMASGNNPVESLFIDEGFGTLDPETLDMALSALNNLQSSGKIIGVISHVEQLKERIPAQIQVIKKSGGFSQLKVVG